MISERLTADTVPRLPSKSSIGYTVFAVTFLASLLLLNALVGVFPFPSYGVWTGNVPLENKLKMLREFAKVGTVLRTGAFAQRWHVCTAVHLLPVLNTTGQNKKTNT
jgi:hypothetical protein